MAQSQLDSSAMVILITISQLFNSNAEKWQMVTSEAWQFFFSSQNGNSNHCSNAFQINTNKMMAAILVYAFHAFPFYTIVEFYKHWL